MDKDEEFKKSIDLTKSPDEVVKQIESYKRDKYRLTCVIKEKYVGGYDCNIYLINTNPTFFERIFYKTKSYVGWYCHELKTIWWRF